MTEPRDGSRHKRFKGDVAVVTGAGGGIGEAYARALHTEGASVVIAELDPDSGAAVAADLGERALFVRTDVGDPASCEAMATAAADAFGGVDHLVNNAAIFGDMEGVGLLSGDPAYLERFMRVNLLGAVYCTRAVVPSMRERGGGSIVNQSSTAAWMALSGFYGVAKAALNSATVGLAAELGAHGIRVNAIAPGPTDTLAFRKQVPAEFQEMIVQSLAIKRMGTPEDHVGPVLFLLSDEARWITGHVLAVDGGQIPRI